ncbi:uncharacterized protein LOC122502751 [Leptopilina heterotoma]|uniref:uncharacterized protein LOC122502751 n=1 Tax=Leptopilina heterotoma TaxID=63436 RepID=UPI001CA7CF60|nr:uncharacterized protein LOC122502751 [Leptopilina heterotoma]
MSTKIFVIFLFLSITSACLITNCPRGGKRNYEDSSIESENNSQQLEKNSDQQTINSWDRILRQNLKNRNPTKNSKELGLLLLLNVCRMLPQREDYKICSSQLLK